MSDLGRGKIGAVLPEFHIIWMVEHCVIRYTNIILQTVLDHEGIELETILSCTCSRAVWKPLTLRFRMKRLPYSTPLSRLGTVKTRERNTFSCTSTWRTAFRSNNSYKVRNVLRQALSLIGRYLYGCVYSWFFPPFVQLRSGGTPYWRSAYRR